MASSQSGQSDECPICMEALTLPCKLPCGHVFCFLCIKGTFNDSPKCSLCRRDISPSYLNNPDLVNFDSVTKTTSDEYVWFYQGNNGWWQYDDRTSNIIETEFKNNTDKFRIQISDQTYEIDFINLYQARTDNPSRKRRIKRDLRNRSIKGVAGISLNRMKSNQKL